MNIFHPFGFVGGGSETLQMGENLDKIIWRVQV